MSLNRIQKLLFSEYCEFEDMVLVESPFAETTRDGKGIRQVHLGNICSDMEFFLLFPLALIVVLIKIKICPFIQD